MKKRDAGILSPLKKITSQPRAKKAPAMMDRDLLLESVTKCMEFCLEESEKFCYDDPTVPMITILCSMVATTITNCCDNREYAVELTKFFAKGLAKLVDENIDDDNEKA